MIFFICPYPPIYGCEENQFAPFRVWGKQIDFINNCHNLQRLIYKF